MLHAGHSVLFDNDKISNHDGHFQWAALCHEILPAFTLHEKRNMRPVEKSFSQRYSRWSGLRGWFFQSDMGMVQELQQIFGLIPPKEFAEMIKEKWASVWWSVSRWMDSILKRIFRREWLPSLRMSVLYLITNKCDSVKFCLSFFDTGGQNCLSSNGCISGCN